MSLLLEIILFFFFSVFFQSSAKYITDLFFLYIYIHIYIFICDHFHKTSLLLGFGKSILE